MSNPLKQRDMYFIIERERLPQGRHYETLPDGRCIVGVNEAKTMDTLDGVTVVQTAAALERLRESILREMGTTAPQQAADGTENPGETATEGTAADEPETVAEDNQEETEVENG